MEEEKKAAEVSPKLRWETPRVETSSAFTKAALACCIDDNNNASGSSGVSLPFC